MKIKNKIALCGQNQNNATAMINYPGMFDLIKGWIIISIITSHSLSYVDSNSFISDAYPPMCRLFFFIIDLLQIGSASMPVLFLISGYGFRKSLPGKCLKKQAKYLLKPYVLVAISTVVLHLFTHYTCFRNTHAAIRETGKVLLGFILGLSNSMTIGSHTVFNVSSTWFLVALFVSWNLLNLLLNKLTLKQTILSVLLCTMLGLFLNKLYIFALSPAMVALFYLLCGYLCKEYNLFARQYPLLFYILSIILLCVQPIFLPFTMAHGVWTGGPLVVLFLLLIGFTCIKFALYLNRYHNRLLDGIRSIGRYSLWIICVHTIEYLGIPWYYVTEKWPGNPFSCLLFETALHCLLIFAGLQLIICFNKHKNRHRLSRH